MIKHPVHRQIITELNNLGSIGDSQQRAWVQRYLGSNKPTRCIKTGDLRKLAKLYVPDIDLINSLYQYGTSFDELAVAAFLVSDYLKTNKHISLPSIDNWLNYTVGWAEVDSLCQSNFTADMLLHYWPDWRKFLRQLSNDSNIHKRRASLVMLCKPLRLSDDEKLLDLSLELVEKLQYEKEILITKAISWILRSMVKFHPDKLAVYLEDNQESLPRIAYRETVKKLTTGKKN